MILPDLWQYTALLTNRNLATSVFFGGKTSISQLIEHCKLYLTLSIFKFLPWLPYMNITISICYFFYNLFIICFYLHGDLSPNFIDFHYSAASHLDTDNTFYSSGNRFFDPIRDTYTQGENTQTEPTNDPQGENPQPRPTNDPVTVTPDTDTTKLANFLESKGHKRIYGTGIRFRTRTCMNEDLIYFSKVTCGIKREHPYLFHKTPGDTMITNSFLNSIRSLNKDYDLNSIK